jgi:hypothetical protein
MQSYRMAKVQSNCHVLLLADKHHYSVPHGFVGQRVKLIYTQQTVEIYQRLNALKLPDMATLWRSLLQTPVHQWPATDQLLAQLLEAE